MYRWYIKRWEIVSFWCDRFGIGLVNRHTCTVLKPLPLSQSAPGSKLPVIGSKTQSKASGKARTVEKAGKVKVQAGMTPSCNRRLVEEEPRLSINDTRERRSEIYRIYAQRYDDIAMHKRHKVRQLFMSQIEDRGDCHWYWQVVCNLLNFIASFEQTSFFEDILNSSRPIRSEL